MTSEEKNIIFELMDTKKNCWRAFKESSDTEMAAKYENEITGVLCVISKLNLFDDYFEYCRKESK